MNGRPLASALWLLGRLRYPNTQLGELSGARPADGTAGSDAAVAETLSWIDDHGLDWAGDFAQITTSTQGVPERPAMQQAVGEVEQSLHLWLEQEWPNMAVTDPESALLVPWLLKHSRSPHKDEQILVVPTTGAAAHRVEASTYLISRGLLQNKDSFQAWARTRGSMEIEPLHYLMRAG